MPSTVCLILRSAPRARLEGRTTAMQRRAIVRRSEIAGAVDTDRGFRPTGGFDAAQYRRRHVAPAGDERGKPAGLAADHKEVDVVGARHDRDPRVGLALVPFRQIAVVDLAVALFEADLRKQ